ncbi:MAG: hypothetical protein KA436_06750 [Oligoflexales bacterium]|nr:hypothetical protein [Oligoflexales bacterium]
MFKSRTLFIQFFLFISLLVSYLITPQLSACELSFSTQLDASGTKYYFAIRQKNKICSAKHFTNFFHSLKSQEAQHYFKKSIQDYFSKPARESWQNMYDSQLKLPDQRRGGIIIIDTTNSNPLQVAPTSSHAQKEFENNFGTSFDPSKIGYPMALDHTHSPKPITDYFQSAAYRQNLSGGLAVIQIIQSGFGQELTQSFELVFAGKRSSFDEVAARQQSQFLQSVFSSLQDFQKQSNLQREEDALREQLLEAQIKFTYMEIDEEGLAIKKKFSVNAADLEDLSKRLQSQEIDKAIEDNFQKQTRNHNELTQANRDLNKHGLSQRPQEARKKLLIFTVDESQKMTTKEIHREQSYAFKTERSSPEGEKLAAALSKRNAAADALSLRPHAPGIRALDTADHTLTAADEYYQQEDKESGDLAVSFAIGLLDLTTSFAPGFSWGRDIYEAINGTDMISGEQLGTLSRSMAVLGVVTAGAGSKVGKALGLIGKIMKGADHAETLRFSGKMLVRNSGLWSSAKHRTALQNAYQHFKKHGNDFPQFPNALKYVEGAHDFMKNPPSGTLTKVRPTGDKIFYHQETNTLAIETADGIARTMYKPKIGKHPYATNLEYFHAQ